MVFAPLTEADYDEIIVAQQVTAIVYVTNDSCRICEISRREFSAVTVDILDQIAVFEVNATTDKWVTERLNIKAAPAILVYTAGIELAALLGFYSRDELQTRLWRIISNRS